MSGTPVSRWGLVAATAALAVVAAGYLSTGGAMFSPGPLHAGGAAPAAQGGVRSHAELGRRCGACHAAPWGGPPMAARCLECHRDIRTALADTTTLHGALTDGTACLQCHGEHRGPAGPLTDGDRLGAVHGQFGFSLEAHDRTAAGRPFGCRDCHRADSFRFDPRDCLACHRDYQAAFITKHTADWGAACDACHDGADRFSRGRFRHDTTGFRLDGAHRKTACAACHPGVGDLAGFSRAPSDCIGCHAKDDRHRGGFGEDCRSCHSTATWEGARFDHEVFPLDHGEGGRIACKTCHEDGKNYKSYTCYNCHEHSRARVEAEHRKVRTRNLDDCIACHRGGRGEGEEHEGRRRDDHH